MFRSIMFSAAVCLSVLGAVTFIYLILLRVLRPKNDRYAVVCYLFGGRYDPSCRVSFARERIRLFGENKRCKIVAVLCEFEDDEEYALRASFNECPDVIFTREEGLEQVLLQIKDEAMKII